MVKRIAWFGRTPEFNSAEVDKELRRQGIDLPPGLPKEGWKKGGTNVQLSSEQFPGSSPVWVWEE